MIDVVIPAYNAHNTIKNTLMSLAFQCLCHLLDIFIIDDNSGTGYQNDIQYFLDNKFFNSISIHKNHKNIGVGYCRKLALDLVQKTENPYVFFIDSDDYMATPYAFNQYILLANKYPSAKVIYSSIYQEMNALDNPELEDYKSFIESDRCGNVLYLHGRIYNKNAIKSINLSFPTTRSNEDLAFNLTFFQIYNKPGDIVFDKHNLVCTNYNINSITRSKKSTRGTPGGLHSVNEIYDSYIACKETFQTLVDYYHNRGVLPTAINSSNFVDKFLFDAYKYMEVFGHFADGEEKELWYQIHAKWYNDIVKPLIKNTSPTYTLKQQWFHNDLKWCDENNPEINKQLALHLKQIKTAYDETKFNELAKKYLTERGYVDYT